MTASLEPLDRATPKSPPDSDKVAPMLILPGFVVRTFPSSGQLAEAARALLGARRLDIRPTTFSHEAAQGVGFNLWAVGPQGREWIALAAGRGVTQAGLAADLAVMRAAA